MNDEVKDWVIDKLDGWIDTYNTFDDDDERENNTAIKLYEKLTKGEELTKENYEELTFHLWQIFYDVE